MAVLEPTFTGDEISTGALFKPFLFLYFC